MTTGRPFQVILSGVFQKRKRETDLRIPIKFWLIEKAVDAEAAKAMCRTSIYTRKKRKEIECEDEQILCVLEWQPTAAFVDYTQAMREELVGREGRKARVEGEKVEAVEICKWETE